MNVIQCCVHLLTFVWMLPQNLLGIAFLLFLKLTHGCSYVDVPQRGIVRVGLRDTHYSVSLGCFLFISTNMTDEFTFNHELGHYKQGLFVGPLYLIVIGLPSVSHVLVHRRWCRNPDYFHFYTESWANRMIAWKPWLLR